MTILRDWLMQPSRITTFYRASIFYSLPVKKRFWRRPMKMPPKNANPNKGAWLDADEYRSQIYNS